MGDAIQIEFDNRLSDHLAAARLYYRSTFWAKGDNVAAALLFASGVALLMLVGPRWWTVILCPLAVLEWFNFLSPARLRTWIFFRRNPKFLETYRLAFSDSGIHFKTVSIDSNIAWTHYTRVLEDPRVIVLVYGPRMVTVIPKRAFRDPAQLASFTELLGRQIGGARAIGA